MGAAESKAGASEPFAKVKVLPKANTNSSQQEKAQQLQSGQEAQQPKLSLAQQRLVDKAANQKAWVYKNERRASPAEVRKKLEAAHMGGRRGQHRPDTLQEQMDSLGGEQEEVMTREQKATKEKEDFLERVATQINAAIKPLSTHSHPSNHKPRGPRLPVSPPVKVPVPESYLKAWVEKLLCNREEILKLLDRRPDKDQFLQPATEAEVGTSVERSLGSTYDTFASFQRAINRTVEAGLDEDLLRQLLQDGSDGVQDQKSLEEGWKTVGAAVESVMQVYINRSNSRFIMNEEWERPQVVDGHGIQASVYLHGAESMIAQGHVALMFIDTGHLVELSDDGRSYAAVLSTDLWQAIKKLVPGKVPSSQRLERVSVLGRQLLQAVVCMEQQFGQAALSRLKVILAVDQEQEYFTASELKQWSFFGLLPENVVILPQPRFPGFAQDDSEALRPVEDSPKILYGAGYAVCLLQAPAAGYTLDETGTKPSFLHGSVLEWLKNSGVVWLNAGVFYDTGRLDILAPDFLAGALFASEREGANMAVLAMAERNKNKLRYHDSILLGRKSKEGETKYVCDLCPSSMRTVRSQQMLQEMTSDGDFFISMHRYLYKISALSRLLHEASSIPVDLILHGYYAYGSMRLSSITCQPGANCAAIACKCNPGPPMEHAVLGAPWLEQIAGALYSQDKRDEYRLKAISLVDLDQLSNSLVTGLPRDLKKGTGQQPKRFDATKMPKPGAPAPPPPPLPNKQPGHNVVLLLSLEHRGPLAKSAFALARLAVLNIVDQLHVIAIRAPTDSESAVDEMLQEITDKELNFNGQLHKSWVAREERKTSDVILESISALRASLVVVPDCELGEASRATAGAAAPVAQPASAPARPQPSNLQKAAAVRARPQATTTAAKPVAAPKPHAGAHAQAHALTSSLALLVARTVTKAPVLVVKHNTAGRFTAGSWAGHHAKGPGSHHHPLVVLVHMEISAVALMVSYACRLLSYPHDVLLLAKTRAFEKPGQPSMRTNRMMVQGKMAAQEGCMKVEERLYPGTMLQELPKAAEAEMADIVMVSVSGEMHISKDHEDLLMHTKSSILIYRNEEIRSEPPESGVHVDVVAEDSEKSEKDGA